MEIKEAIFIFFAAITVGSAFYIAISRNIVYSVFSLLLTLGSMAALYALLGADFLAAIQLLVYVGGILVLIIFAVMVVQGIEKGKDTNPRRFPYIALLIAVSMAGVWISLIWKTKWIVNPNTYAPITKNLGNSFLKEYLLPFEVISVLLLVGLIGAIAIARLAHQNTKSDNNNN